MGFSSIQKFLATGLVGLSISSFAQLPKIDMKDNLSGLAYNRNFAGSQAADSHIFFTDGTYCYTSGGGGAFAVLGGKWHYTNPSQISIELNPINENYFAYWDIDTNSAEQSSIKFSYWLTYQQDKFLVGFGDDKPTQMAWYSINNNATTPIIPKNAKAVFLSDGSKDRF